MKILAAVGVASAIALAASAPADARQGCGPGFHRAYNGVCRPNRDTRMRMRQMRWTEGRYYSGRGYCGTTAGTSIAIAATASGSTSKSGSASRRHDSGDG